MKTNYPTIITIGRFTKWCLTTLKNTFFGIGGIALLVIVGLYIAGALTGPLRLYLVGIASALLLLCGGLLVLSYARLWLNRSFSDLRTQVSDVRTQVSDVRTQVSDVRTQVSDVRTQVSDMRRALGVAEATLARINVCNFPLFQQSNRRLTDEDLKHFAREWAPKLGLNLDARAVGYIAHRICLTEDTCIGRLAGNLETMLLRILIARSVKEQSLEVLEIGTLFGVGTAMIHENCQGFFSNVHVTIIDPLSGYYGRGQLDVITKMPVTLNIFIHNMQRMNIPESDYTIIQKLSTEDEALEQASKRRYNLLIIDGDHSYFGVKHDFCNYRRLVKHGGYIVFDDYDHSKWPGITSFIDNEVFSLPDLKFVGAEANTAIFKVITEQETEEKPSEFKLNKDIAKPTDDFTYMLNAVTIQDRAEHFHKIATNEGFTRGKILEIGGVTDRRVLSYFKNFDYLNLNLENSQVLPTIIGDITECNAVLADASFDLIFSKDTFEHVTKPHDAARQIVRLLRPGGLCYVVTVFAWRYHPVPMDYWRFSPEGLAMLFSELECIERNFDICQRRDDITGFYENNTDAVPVDELGGWRENWRVYYVGKKPRQELQTNNSI